MFVIVLSTILVLAAWTGIVVAGAVEGWWRQPLAPSRDSRAFMDAAITTIDRTRRGNVAFVLIENGKVFDEHFTSVGQAVDRDTLFQVASMSKWITAWGVMTLVEAGNLLEVLGAGWIAIMLTAVIIGWRFRRADPKPRSLAPPTKQSV